MIKKLIGTFLVLLFLMGFLLNFHFDIQYDMNIFEYLSRSRALTEEEEEWIRERGKIIYGSDQSSPPLRYIDERTGQYSGLVVDYIRALSIELKTEIVFEPVEAWGDALDNVKNRERDCFDMIASPEREKMFNFSDPIYSLSGTILVSKDNQDIRGYKDLEGKKIAVPKSDYAVEFLKDKLQNVEYVYMRSMTQCMELIASGEVDAVVGDEPVITYLKDKLNMRDGFKTMDKPMYEKDAVLAVPKSDKILVSILNKGIYELKKKRVMENIQAKWFGISDSFAREDKTDKALLMSFYLIVVMIPFLYIIFYWNRRLKREVDRRTRELTLSRNNLQRTFDGLKHPMIVLDEEHRIMNINEAFLEMSNVGVHEVIGESIWGMNGFILKDDIKDIVRGTFETKDHQQFEVEKGEGIFQVNTFPLENQEDAFEKILIMIEDVTNVRISERQMLQDNKMMAVGQLAAGVAHEIRNPLGIIRNYCYILKKNKNNSWERTDKAVKVIESSVERAAGIIDNLLNFSRISSDTVKELCMSEFLQEMIKLEDRFLKKHNVACTIECDSAYTCFTMEESLKHIFMNLVSNSVDAMENGGEIHIECRDHQGQLLINFKDSGCGIKKENMEKIFNPFFSTKIHGKGTGLGLYIVYNEVSKIGGRIEVESEIDRGTNFKILLPYGRGD